ncbi:GspE/PulE family protein [Patescibacteria group bacterium]|nr:GspE/PulE family protein [Patescibacteria group bacterium]
MIAKQVSDALKKEGILSKETSSKLKEYEKLQMGNVLDFCIEQGMVPSSKLISLLQESHSLQVVDLNQVKIYPEVIKKLPSSICLEHLVVPFQEDDAYIYVAMARPENTELIAYMKKALKKNIAVYLANQRDIKQTLEEAFNNSAEDSKKTITELIQRACRANNNPETMAQEAPIISLLNQMLIFGIKSEASDMHIEPREDSVSVRFRMDGILHQFFTLPRELLAPIIARTKILAQLRIDEHMRPQDGRFSFNESGYKVAVRLSIIPTLHGQKASLRFLDTDNEQLSLNTLGLSKSNREALVKTLGLSSGMVIVTGPTGSGKTTTLYSLVKAIDRQQVNISTIEDPIEYHLNGANQMQVNPHVNLNFANGLRSILRQDPDIIMIGEIRDKETATIAINAAMTGHLVLTSLHTNSAAAAIPRLLDMGVEPYLVASTLKTIIGQRLVRSICDSCKTEFTTNSLPKEYVEKYSDKSQPTVAKGKGCPECLDTGYFGRTGVFEILNVDEDIHDLIISRAHTSAIEKSAKDKNMKTMHEDGIMKVLNKQTTLEEIIRVTK